MFPNPQDALPLPPHPNVEQYKKLAKDLLRASKSGSPEAIHEWSAAWAKSLVKKLAINIAEPLPFRVNQWIRGVTKFAKSKLGKDGKLSDAQFVIARSQGFLSWPKFVRHLETIGREDTAEAQFEAAVDAIVSGDIATLRRLLHANPKLVHQRSTREHNATLLHYVSANGIEGYRQRTPGNIVEIARLLLDAGSDVEATCPVYGSDCTTLGLVATSVHPAKAGVMDDLLRLLLDRGAQMDKKGSAGRAHSLVFACLANGRPEAARFLASNGAPLDFISAAALDRMEVVRERFNADGSRKTSLTEKLMQEAFRYACGYGANRVVEFLLDHGADMAEHTGDGQSGLHYTVIFGRLDTLKLLLQRHPSLEAKNMYGGTVLGQAMWSAAHGGDPDRYAQIFETLIAAGAKVPERHVPIHPQLDALLERYGSRPEPKWWWYGEGPGEEE